MDPSRLGIKKIICGAEPGGGIPSIRKKIEEDFGCLLTEGLGNSDAAPIIFGECPNQKGMHFCAQEFILCELIDPDTGEVLEMKRMQQVNWFIRLSIVRVVPLFDFGQGTGSRCGHRLAIVEGRVSVCAASVVPMTC